MSAEPSVEHYLTLKSWPERYRALMRWGSTEALRPKERSSENAIKQCSADTWLVLHSTVPICRFGLDSESKLVAGLGRMLLAELHLQQRQGLSQNFTANIVKQTALHKHLSASRANGVTKIIERALALIEENN